MGRGKGVKEKKDLQNINLAMPERAKLVSRGNRTRKKKLTA